MSSTQVWFSLDIPRSPLCMQYWALVHTVTNLWNGYTRNVILARFQDSVCVYRLWFWITVLRFSKWNTGNDYMSISFSTMRTQQDYTSKYSLSILKWSALDCHCLTYFHDWRLRAWLELFTLIWSMDLTKTSASSGNDNRCTMHIDYKQIFL